MSLFSSIFINVILAIVVIIIGQVVKANGASYVVGMVKAVGIHITQIFLGMLTVMLGSIAYAFKKRWQFQYGFTEICFSAWSAWQVAAGLSAHEAFFSHAVALTGSVYISARGVGNMSDAKAKKLARKT